MDPVVLQRDHQPDLRFQGDSLRRALFRKRSEAAFVSRNIDLELKAMAGSTCRARWGAGRAWIIRAQRRRRAALANAAAYERLLRERDGLTRLLGQ